MKPTNHVLNWMKANNVPLTKENYLHIDRMGQEIPEGGDAEEEIPREIQAAELRAIRRADQAFLPAIGVGYGKKTAR